MGMFESVVGLATNVAGQASGASAAVGTVKSIFDSLLGGGRTGSAGVTFENERKNGNVAFHNAKLTLKWRAADAILKAYGHPQGLVGFGWKNGQTPSSASGNFKRAETAFWTILDKFLNDVKKGVVQIQPDWGLSEPDDTAVSNYLGVSTFGTGSVLSGGVKNTDIFNGGNPQTGGPMPNVGVKTNDVFANIPWWLWALGAYLILKRK